MKASVHFNFNDYCLILILFVFFSQSLFIFCDTLLTLHVKFCVMVGFNRTNYNKLVVSSMQLDWYILFQY